MLTSDNLELLIAIVDNGSFSAAARALGKTQSAVSMAIANIETDVGLVLFDRSRREPIPSAALLSLLPDARLVSHRIAAIHHQLHDLSTGVESLITIGVAADINPNPIAAAIAGVAQHYPGIEIVVVIKPQEALIAALHRSELDACVAYGGLDLNAQESIHALWVETLIAVASPEHPLVKDSNAALSIEDLIAHRQILIASAEAPPVDIRPVVSARQWKVENASMVLALVETGAGWANLPRSFVKESINQGRVVELVFNNIENGLALPVYLRQLQKYPQGKALALFQKLLRAPTGVIC